MKAITVLVMTMAPVTLVGASAAAAEGGSVAHEEATHHVEVPEDVRMVAPPGSCVLNPDADRCVSLERYVDDRWQRLATNRAVRHGSGRISEIAGFNCHHRRLIPYRTDAFAYAVVNNIGYTGTDRAYQNHTCWP